MDFGFQLQLLKIAYTLLSLLYCGSLIDCLHPNFSVYKDFNKKYISGVRSELCPTEYSSYVYLVSGYIYIP